MSDTPSEESTSTRPSLLGRFSAVFTATAPSFPGRRSAKGTRTSQVTFVDPVAEAPATPHTPASDDGCGAAMSTTTPSGIFPSNNDAATEAARVRDSCVIDENAVETLALLDAAGYDAPFTLEQIPRGYSEALRALNNYVANQMVVKEEHTSKVLQVQSSNVQQTTKCQEKRFESETNAHDLAAEHDADIARAKENRAAVNLIRQAKEQLGKDELDARRKCDKVSNELRRANAERQRLARMK